MVCAVLGRAATPPVDLAERGPGVSLFAKDDYRPRSGDRLFGLKAESVPARADGPGFGPKTNRRAVSPHYAFSMA